VNFDDFAGPPPTDSELLPISCPTIFVAGISRHNLQTVEDLTVELLDDPDPDDLLRVWAAMEDGTVSGYELETVRQGGRQDTGAVRTAGHSKINGAIVRLDILEASFPRTARRARELYFMGSNKLRLFTLSPVVVKTESEESMPADMYVWQGIKGRTRGGGRRDGKARCGVTKPQETDHGRCHCSTRQSIMIRRQRLRRLRLGRSVA
jgi:hypothetical protein